MASAAPFIVVSLPRSRSAWMAHFLAFGGRYAVGHDTLVECNSIAQFISGFRLMAGTCETGAVLGWRIIRQVMPEVKLVTVRRPVHEVAASFARFGIPVDEKELEARAGAEREAFSALKGAHDLKMLTGGCGPQSYVGAERRVVGRR